MIPCKRPGKVLILSKMFHLSTNPITSNLNQAIKNEIYNVLTNIPQTLVVEEVTKSAVGRRHWSNNCCLYRFIRIGENQKKETGFATTQYMGPTCRSGLVCKSIYILSLYHNLIILHRIHQFDRIFLHTTVKFRIILQSYLFF